MTLEADLEKALDEAFRAALILTGRIDAAEAAVSDAIDASAPALSGEALLVETAKAAVRRRDLFRARPDASSILPVELQALSLLAPSRRDCFVLRILMRLDAELCSRILALSQREVEEELCESLRELPQAVKSTSSAKVS
jgi:hypothetical protein